MLCFLRGSLFFLGTAIKMYALDYSDPSLESLKEQKRTMKMVMKKALKIEKSKELMGILSEDQKNIRLLKNKSSFIDLPFKDQKEHINIDSILSQGKKIKDLNPNHEADKDRLYIFISFSMPEEEIKYLLRESKKYNGVLVLRGIYQGFKETIEKIKEINKEEMAAIIIDPRLFQTFDIKVVPAFVLTQRIPTNIDGNIKYIKALGSVSIEYFLAKIDEWNGEDQ